MCHEIGIPPQDCAVVAEAARVVVTVAAVAHAAATFVDDASAVGVVKVAAVSCVENDLISRASASCCLL